MRSASVIRSLVGWTTPASSLGRYRFDWRIRRLGADLPARCFFWRPSFSYLLASHSYLVLCRVGIAMGLWKCDSGALDWAGPANRLYPLAADWALLPLLLRHRL